MFGLYNYVLKNIIVIIILDTFHIHWSKFISQALIFNYYLKKKKGGNYIDTILRPFRIFVRFILFVSDQKD